MECLRQQKRDQTTRSSLQAFINWFRYQATKASQVQADQDARQDRPIEIPAERKRVRFHFPRARRAAASSRT
jgi:ATPase subunit of ABC transporter with duplicated ATPase domains